MGMNTSQFKIIGYDRLGKDNIEGLRFAWKKENVSNYIESAAFINRRKDINENICGYTTSVSAGCVLRTFKSQCSFCRTGNLLPFAGFLSYKEIAKQNVFMVLTDMYCKDNPNLANKKREFAYMGQGEPGYSYSQVRLAIELTNRIMRQLDQSVYRHVFATCGVPEAIYAYKNDLRDFFTERVTLHFSLHATQQRSKVMPINDLYSYKDIISSLDDILDISGEKPCIGIMLFQNFKPYNKIFDYTNSYDVIKKILLELDPLKIRLSFCEYNESSDIGSAMTYSIEEAYAILQMAKKLGFEAKLFSSFGKEKQTACGMLGAKEPEKRASIHWQELDEMANELIEKNS